MNVGEINQNIRRKSFQQNNVPFNTMNNNNFQVVKSSKRKSISSKKNPTFKNSINKNQKQKFIPKNNNHNPLRHYISSNSFNVKVLSFKDEIPKNNNEMKL